MGRERERERKTETVKGKYITMKFIYAVISILQTHNGFYLDLLKINV